MPSLLQKWTMDGSLSARKQTRTGIWVKRQFRLTQSTEFKRVRRQGKSFAHPLLVLVLLPKPQPGFEVGISAGRSVGKAVRRNRAKRQIRALIDELLPSLKGGWTGIVIARQSITSASFDEIREALQSCFRRAGYLPRAE